MKQDKPTHKSPYPIRLNKHGGKRKDSGRKKKYGEPTTTIRIPMSLKEEIIKFIKSFTY